jgi:hypothetical protein
MAEVIWKDIIWRGADREMEIKDLLTVLKGYGSVELVSFERPSRFRGEINICLDEHGVKHITLFYLEVMGEKRRGTGRQALIDLKRIFGGNVCALHPGESNSNAECKNGATANQTTLESTMFWIRMFEEGLIQSIEDDFICLYENTTHEELVAIKKKLAASHTLSIEESVRLEKH